MNCFKFQTHGCGPEDGTDKNASRNGKSDLNSSRPFESMNWMSVPDWYERQNSVKVAGRIFVFLEFGSADLS